ncbi:MAG: hypothetical protein GDA49_08650 [Rhodospirillales bacterium]|nr:hypothetical protein [Rhodospirillales bacterium]
MVRLVEFDAHVEALTRFVEDTPREEIIGATVDRLRGGADPLDLVRAAALGVSRSSELPSDHHGGPIHPIAGIHAVVGLTKRLEGESANLPALQCIALANKHVNLPSMGPAAMVAFDNLKRDVETGKVLTRLEKAMLDREPRLAERAVTLCCEKATPGQILNSLLTTSLRRNNLDDHYFLYPLYAMRALDAIGWEWAPIILRPVVRYLSRHHSFDAFGEFNADTIRDGITYFNRFTEHEAMVADYNLTEERVPQASGPHEADAIAALADEVGAVTTISALPEIVARAMNTGLSLEGTCEALSVGGARFFLRSHSSNPFDVHVHTGIAARRYLIGFPEVDFRKKVLALIGWAWSYEIRYLDATLTKDWENVGDVSDAPAAQAILDEIESRILGIDGYDFNNLPTVINELVEPDEVRNVVALAETYMKAGHPADDLFALTARLVCREDVSEMHAYKLQQAAYEEYHACAEDLRWVHAVSAVKQVAVVVSMTPHRVFPQIAETLAA